MMMRYLGLGVGHLNEANSRTEQHDLIVTQEDTHESPLLDPAPHAADLLHHDDEEESLSDYFSDEEADEGLNPDAYEF
jgi:hypothetical protein